MVRAASNVGANAHLVVLLGGDAGLRGGEIRALEWSDINLKKRQLRVERNDWRGEITTTKGNRVRYVPLTQRLAAALKAYRHLRGLRVVCQDDRRPFAEHHLTDLLAKVGRRANVRSNGPHIPRHTFCPHLAMKGAATRAIQELAGIAISRRRSATCISVHRPSSMRFDCWMARKIRQILETCWRRRNPQK